MLLILSCSSKGSETSLMTGNEKTMSGIKMKSYKEKELQFTLDAQSGYSTDSSDNYTLIKPLYKRVTGDSIRVHSDSCISGKTEITYYGNVIVEFEDSMTLYTDSMRYFTESDSAITEDSVLIIKNNNKMKSKGFAGSNGFNKITFLGKVVLYDE
jgi:LPS export ABC transporter protein LptC